MWPTMPFCMTPNHVNTIACSYVVSMWGEWHPVQDGRVLIVHSASPYSRRTGSLERWPYACKHGLLTISLIGGEGDPGSPYR
ncbi:hypothetical protein GDO78_002956 [Eleutherodactylus coqui]|uniref:Uncharacterized protein n=1 Tax=Eleutherodactylus coqui TaxID=57060 RepID=A0A8J6EVX5_ELECQ|nr:hypothetical protein GDO78_002956 [Eleutherodactylus coqui]